MRSFFKKPTWANADTEAPLTEFYRRSQHLYSDIVAEQQHNAESDHEEEKQPNPVTDEELRGERHVKRQCTSSNNRVTVSSCPVPKPTSFTIKGRQTNPVDLDIATKPLECTTTVEQLLPEPVSETSNDESLSEEEFPELARKARERARQHVAPSSGHAPTMQKPDLHKPRNEFNAESPDPIVPGPHCKTGEAPLCDPVVHILITSSIENTKPLLVRRRLSQNLGDVRKAWCNKQAFSPKLAFSIFLTWKGRRVFDVTTCQSLGIRAPAASDSSFFANSFSNDDGILRIHMEATTQELVEMQKRQGYMSLHQAERSSIAREEITEQVIRITLRTPSSEDFKLKVRPTSKISDVIKTFRTALEISEKVVDFHFDGERLNPDSSVRDNDIDDLDCIDVVIKNCR
ncbi:hypothetical protein D8B26_006905 [Coccidioides posadasii str. Silveira]|uniref:Uncharacterized protein n=3 Tax=Coccidioides posadasii TaxID=199306 RepID=E9DG20_COCPS|nr:hypothetical protein CPC735_000630 [Coccidioides posadasii C735 delta SOWgp]EER24719.1 hypothetical protein CPC735_000630 [Coccidioides posadasii C735 delta SOWgp]EFW14511.1 conserved hypothetical protein [Coccidioides posadasii str. Silveira]KMM68285.1 hypothetical protein CPAG_04615 [Coccidioides posadasii RMSCC 3488]QVM12274.1 hypothetical protein D8B26_006905 [Coccidioides posadasii str. Silveira]|eukprot:XP_003066864.1 hypothetical protein CPC735_000630 [Coccidioides posadasii C735 delta SOWgp]